MDQCLGLKFHTDSVSDKLVFKLATERGNGKETALLMLTRLDAVLDHTHIYAYIKFFLRNGKQEIDLIIC